MNYNDLVRLGTHFMGVWTRQDVEEVVGLYTVDLEYADPNTRGPVRGAAAMRRYLTKLFAQWQMSWELVELHPYQEGAGCSAQWKAVIGPKLGDGAVTVLGMDHIELLGDKIKCNRVFFDRMAIANFMVGRAK